MGIDVSEAGRLAAQPGPAGHRRRPAAAPRLARADQLPATTAWSARAPTSTRCSPSRPSRPAPGCTSRPPSPSRSSTRTGRVVGVTGRDRRQASRSSSARRSCSPATASPASSPSALGVHRNDKRPLGVAVRRYYTSPRTHDDYLESWLELWDGAPNESDLLPGYGWIFGMGDGTVNVGLGVLNSSAGFQKTDYRALLTRWLDNTPEEWGLREAERHRPDPRRRRCRWASTAPRTTARPAARRRLRRLGQPVQRRGHPVRDGVGQVRRRGRRPGAGPPGRARAASARCAATRARCGASGAPTTASAACS